MRIVGRESWTVGSALTASSSGVITYPFSSGARKPRENMPLSLWEKHHSVGSRRGELRCVGNAHVPPIVFYKFAFQWGRAAAGESGGTSPGFAVIVSESAMGFLSVSKSQVFIRDSSGSAHMLEDRVEDA